MEHRSGPCYSAKVTPVGGKCLDGLPRALEEQTVGGGLIAIKQTVELRWYGKYRMIVADIKQVLAALFYPLLLSISLAFWAMAVFAGVVAYRHLPAMCAGLAVPSK